uniref:PH domain-containing protein n=1 Tax=Lotharella globosa TaxID=91324 RepID=A0A7S4DL75_9EUKA|mmetsp:Transcript_13824/g.26196  ORF Transcript_13824/g.26196 Transcript_13824/m.26196 type:complete len:768 (+) Transcript_13824:1-2304(+)
MLHRFPLMVRVGRVTIRRVSFFLKDLFLGYRGAAEKKGAKEEALYVDFLESKGSGPVLEEITQNEVKYMEKHGHKHQLAIDKQRVAHTLKTFLEAWVKSLVPQVVKKGGLVGSATSQIIGSMFSSFFDFGGGGKGKKTLGTETVDGRVKKASMLVRVGRQLAAKIVAKKTWNNRLVTAHDTDYFLPVIIKGITEKRTSRLKKWVHAFMELKGNTLFYADCDKHTGKKLHPEKKLDLSQATEVKLLNVPHKEIFIQTAGRSRWIRIPVEVPGPSIKQWFEEIRNHQRRNLRGMIRVHLVECKGLPSHGHIHIGVHMHISAKIAGASGEEHDIPPVRSKTHRISSNPNWGDEELVVGPLTPDSKVLILNLHYSRHRTANARIELPLTAITGETQNFSLPWTPPDPKRDAKTKPPENPGGDTKEPATVKSPRNSTASKSRGKSNAGVGMGTLVFKAQRSERVIRYKHQLYMAPSSHEGSAKNLTPLDNNLQDSLKPNLGGSLNSASSPGKRNSITSSLGDPPRKQPADSDDWNSHDLMSLMSTLKGDTAMVLRELDEGDYGETKGNLTRRTSIDSVDPILLEAPSAQPPKPPTTRAPTTSPNMHPRRRRSTVDEEKDLDDLQSIATDFTETTYGGSMATINRGSIVGPSPFDTGFYDKVMTKYMVYKIGPLGRKHLREIAIGESHFFTRRPTGKGKAKHGKIPFSNIVDVKLLKKKGPEYFEINFSGSVMKGRRRYIAQTPEQAMQIVSKLTAVSQKHKEKDVKEESTRR